MRIRPTDTLFGLPALKLRWLLRRVDAWDGFDVDDVRELLSCSRRTAARLVADLKEAGYIEPSQSARPGEQPWQLTVQGRAYSIASAARPIKRATADRLLQELLDRIDAINADDELAYRVTEAVVFGSYLGDAPTVGDLDVGVRLESRLPPDADYRAHRDARVALARENGRIFYTWQQELLWPDMEVWLKLKSRSRGLSLHNMKTDRIFDLANVERRVIYADGHRV